MLTGCLCVRIVIPWRDLFFLEEVAVSVGRINIKRILAVIYVNKTSFIIIKLIIELS